MRILLLAAAIAAAYVLGTKSGRARFDQLKSQVDRVRHDPQLRQDAADAADLLTQKASEVADQATDAAVHVAHRFASTNTHSDDSEGLAGTPR